MESTAESSTPTESTAQSGDPAGERDAARATRERPRGTAPLLYPEYGLVEAVVGFGLLYLLVDLATPVLVDALADTLPGFVPDPLTTLAAILLWVVVTVGLGAAIFDQVRDNPREFESRAERDGFLAANRPTASRVAYNLTLLVFGGATAALAWETVRALFADLLVVVVELGGTVPPGLSVTNGAVFVFFFVGFAAFSRGLDRLLVDGVREALYRYYAREE